jgi:hypothetical protein
MMRKISLQWLMYTIWPLDLGNLTRSEVFRELPRLQAQGLKALEAMQPALGPSRRLPAHTVTRGVA